MHQIITKTYTNLQVPNYLTFAQQTVWPVLGTPSKSGLTGATGALTFPKLVVKVVSTKDPNHVTRTKNGTFFSRLNPTKCFEVKARVGLENPSRNLTSLSTLRNFERLTTTIDNPEPVDRKQTQWYERNPSICARPYNRKRRKY